MYFIHFFAFPLGNKEKTEHGDYLYKDTIYPGTFSDSTGKLLYGKNELLGVDISYGLYKMRAGH